MLTPESEPGDSKALHPSFGPAPIELLRIILDMSGEESALAGLPGGQDPTLVLADPRLRELVEIVDIAIQIHGAKAREWFVRPEPELGYVHPATLMRDPANGRKLVKQSLMNHLRGVFALGQDGRVLPKIRPRMALDAGPALPRPPKTRRRPKPKKKRRS